MCAYFKACNYPDKPDSTPQDFWLGFDMEEKHNQSFYIPSSYVHHTDNNMYTIHNDFSVLQLGEDSRYHWIYTFLEDS